MKNWPLQPHNQLSVTISKLGFDNDIKDYLMILYMDFRQDSLMEFQ